MKKRRLTAIKYNMEGEMQSATSDYVQKMEVQEIYDEIFIRDTRNFLACVHCYRQEKIVLINILKWVIIYLIF